MKAKLSEQLAVLLFVMCCFSDAITQESFAQKSSTPHSAKTVFAQVSPSVLTIIASRSGKTMQGSGVAFAKGTGGAWVVTNAHVLRDAERIAISQGKSTFLGRVKAIDDEWDLALLQLESNALNVAEIAKDSTISVGDRVYAIGSPSGLKNSLSEGLVSGIRSYKDTRVYQTTASISAGSSGGGLFDSTGRLIGITTFKYRDAENINFAVDAILAEKLRQATMASSVFSARLLAVEALAPESPTTPSFFDSIPFAIIKESESALSNSFIKWLARNPPPSGKSWVDELENAQAGLATSSKGDHEAFVRKCGKYAASVLGEFNKQEYASWKAEFIGSKSHTDPRQKEQLPASDNVVMLQCVLTGTLDGRKMERILEVDFERGLVNGNAATITENAIKFSVFAKTMELVYTLSRVSGHLAIGSESTPLIFAGPCEKVIGRKF